MLLLSHSTSVMCPSTPNFEKCCRCLSISIIQCCTCQQVFPGAALLRSMGGGHVGVVSFLVYLVASCRWCDGRLVWALVLCVCIVIEWWCRKKMRMRREMNGGGGRSPSVPVLSSCLCQTSFMCEYCVHQSLSPVPGRRKSFMTQNIA